MRKRVWSLDALKALAICMVVPLHTGLFSVDIVQSPSVGTYVQFMLRLLCEGVPIFFFVSGYLMLGRQGFDVEKHCRRLGKILALLIMWSVLLVVLQALVMGVPVTPSGVIKLVLSTRSGSQYTGPLWYLQALVGIYILYPFIKALFEKDQGVKLAIGLVGLLAIATSAVSWVFPALMPALPGHWAEALGAGGGVARSGQSIREPLPSCVLRFRRRSGALQG